MTIDLAGKVALVTGAGRGIGAATARAFVGAGAEVVVHDASPTHELHRLQEDLGRRATIVTADLVEHDAAPRLWRDAMAWRNRIDILVNNAGVYEKACVTDDFDSWERSWNRTLAINLLAGAHLCREAIRHFRTRGGGRIINVASRAAFRGDGPDYSNYAASKGAMVSLTRTIARGFASENILAFVIAPGFVRTLLNAEFFREHGENAALREIPLGIMAEPEDIAHFVVFLSTDLARHATGATFDINGASYVR